MEHADAVPIVELLDERRHLLDVASWMLGSPGEAESVVDEAYCRWYGLSDAARRLITAPRSWLAKTTRAICLGRPATPDRADGTTCAVGAAEGLRAPEHQAATVEGEAGRVLLSALDSLSPAERAAFVLSDVVGTTPDMIDDIVGRTEPECVELSDRARHSLRLRSSCPTTPAEHDTLAHAVRRACVNEDTDLLASLLCPDATAFFDGGGKVRALARPVHGSRQVAQSLLTLLARHPRITLTTHSVNGSTGLVVRYDQQVAAVIGLDIANHQVAQVWVVLNPDKLRSWNDPPAPEGPSSHQHPSPQSGGRP